MSDNNGNNHVRGGIGIGTVIAVIISFLKWKHIGWAILHGILGWFYVIYFLITYGCQLSQ